MTMPMKSLVAAIYLAATSALIAFPSVARSEGAAAARAGRPWINASLSTERRVALLLPKMAREQKMKLVFGYYATDFPPRKSKAPEGSRVGSAGYVPGIPALGIPPQWQSDAGIGVASQVAAPVKRERTALPSKLAIAATWDPEVARRGGAMIGAEARASGFNVMGSSQASGRIYQAAA